MDDTGARGAAASSVLRGWAGWVGLALACGGDQLVVGEELARTGDIGSKTPSPRPAWEQPAPLPWSWRGARPAQRSAKGSSAVGRLATSAVGVASSLATPATSLPTAPSEISRFGDRARARARGQRKPDVWLGGSTRTAQRRLVMPICCARGLHPRRVVQRPQLIEGFVYSLEQIRNARRRRRTELAHHG